MSRLLSYILLLLLYSIPACLGQDSSRMIRLTMAEGLPSNNVYSLLQDRNGYLWVTTDNGIAKYNGYTFRTFNAADGLPLEMFGIFEDAQRRLWVDYYGYTLGYIKDNKVKFIDYEFAKDAIKGFRTMVRNGRVFFLADDDLVEIDSNDKPIAYPVPSPRPRIFIHPEPDKFLNIYGNRLFECRIADGQLACKFLCTLPEVMVNAQIIQRNVTDSGFLGYAPGASFLHFYNIYTCTYEHIDLTRYGAKESEGILLFYRLDDRVCVITNEALYLLDLNLRLIERKIDHNTIQNLSQVSFFITDGSANEWYATTADGVLMRPSTPILFRGNKHIAALTKSVNVGNTTSGNSYWWSSKQKTLYAVSPDLSIRFFTSFPNADVQAVREHGDELYIAFTQSVFNGVYTYNVPQRKLDFFTAGRYISYTSHEEEKKQVGYDDHFLTSIFNLNEYRPGIFFSSSRGGGIFKITRSNDSAHIQRFFSDRYPNMVFDSFNNKYWLYNKERLALFDPETGKQAIMPIEQLKRLNISSISQLQVDKHNNIYILTDKLIFQFNLRSFKLRYLHPNVDLTNVLMRIQGNMVFLAGNFGLGYATISDDGMLSPFTIFRNIRRHYYNRIYDLMVNSQNNIIITTDQAAYSLSVSELLAAKAQLNAKQDSRLVVSSPEQKSIQSGDTIHLQQETEMLNFDLINFYGSGRRQFIYKIGDKNEWQTTEAGEVYIGEVPAGRMYKIQCYVHDDILKSKTYTFYIYRSPYWYQTSTWRIVFWIAGALLFATLVLGIVLLTRNIVARSNEKRRLLTDLELRAIHAQINPHFIFNTLGSAMYFISKKKMDDAYLHVNKFSRLLRSYLQASRNRYVTLSEELEMLKNYIELQQIRFENKFGYEINVENKVAADAIQIPSLLLQPLVENAINHGLFHLPEGKKGSLQIRFYQGSSSDELICTIEDNGVGRRKSREIRRSSDAQYESYGTKLTQELINIFKKYEKMNIYLEYIDKPEPESGTIVKLTIRNLKYVA
ncbi:histidine kinase [Polluticoccus soli]|uniref:sensor histidine kinase n=1 Tax=Polluticoccus soli TaxID=3034150 RepID=UPI0023E31DDC|nr:histidine kinase [Flavipsychrobacter sp. JY13-12]